MLEVMILDITAQSDTFKILLRKLMVSRMSMNRFGLLVCWGSLDLRARGDDRGQDTNK